MSEKVTDGKAHAGWQVRILEPKTLVWGLVLGALVSVGLGWLFVYVGARVMQTVLLTMAGYLLFAYVGLWGACQPLRRSTNWWLVLLYVCLWLVAICWGAWLIYDEIEIGEFGIRLDSRHSSHVSMPWFILVVALPLYAFFGWLVTYTFFCLFRPRYLSVLAASEEAGSAAGSNLLSVLAGVWFLDKMSDGKKRRKRDHKLGSYWSDHDDDGNYDPGAWRRRYD